MLKKGFIGNLSDYVASRVDRDEHIFNKAQEVFGLLKYLADSAEPEKFIGLFSEWLVFDYRQKIFNGDTGLEYFVKHNPLRLSASEHRAYKDMLDFEVGLFEVKSVDQARGVTIESVANGATHFVLDINASLSLHPGETIWTRIAPIEGIYHMVGSSALSMPIKIMSGMKEEISKWDKNSFDAREAASFRSPNHSGVGQISRMIRTADKDTPPQDYAQAEKRFTEALKKCKMEKLFSIMTYKKWITNEKKYGTEFAIRAIISLLPPTTSEKDADLVLNASMEFANNIPRKFLKGESPNEADADFDTKNYGGIVRMNSYSKEKFVNKLEQAHTLMVSGDFQAAYKTYEEVARDLLEDKIPFFDAFRIFANTAVCCFPKDDFAFGEEILNASLRINPLYDFALRTKERIVEPYDTSISAVPKKDRKLVIGLREMLRMNGIRKYRRSVFRKYEDFLREIGVCMEYKTSSVQNAFVVGKDGGTKRIGRNDICYCGSGKKFKRCCGA